MKKIDGFDRFVFAGAFVNILVILFLIYVWIASLQ
jgi:hypothetical protein